MRTYGAQALKEAVSTRVRDICARLSAFLRTYAAHMLLKKLERQQESRTLKEQEKIEATGKHALKEAIEATGEQDICTTT